MTNKHTKLRGTHENLGTNLQIVDQVFDQGFGQGLGQGGEPERLCTVLPGLKDKLENQFVVFLC